MHLHMYIHTTGVLCTYISLVYYVRTYHWCTMYVHITGVLMGGDYVDQAFCCHLPLSCSKPVCQMFGHTSPILSVHIDEEEEKIYSIAFDNCVKVRCKHKFVFVSTYIHNAVDCIHLQYSAGLCACLSVCVCVCVCVQVWSLCEYQCLTTVISGMHKVVGSVDGR